MVIPSLRAGATTIDGTGKYVTPGVIDIHSHLGDYPSPGIQALSDGNEATGPITADVWAEHSVWPQDPGFSRALVNGGAGGTMALDLRPDWDGDQQAGWLQKSYDAIKRARSEQGWDIHAIAQAESLVDFARAFSLRHYTNSSAQSHAKHRPRP